MKGWEEGDGNRESLKCPRASSARETAIWGASLCLISSVLKMLVFIIFAIALPAFMEHHSGSSSSSSVILLSGLLLRHTFQSRKLFGESSIRNMEMGLLQGPQVIKSGACFRLERLIFLSPGECCTSFFWVQDPPGWDISHKPWALKRGESHLLLLLLKSEWKSQLGTAIKPAECNCGNEALGLTGR